MLYALWALKFENGWNMSDHSSFFSLSLMVRQSQNDFFKTMFFPKNKWMNSTLLHTMKPQVDLLLFVFWKKLKTSERYFEINWPLTMAYLETNIYICPLFGKSLIMPFNYSSQEILLFTLYTVPVLLIFAFSSHYSREDIN